MTTITISLSELRQWADRTFDVLASSGHKEFNVPSGLYNIVDPADIWSLDQHISVSDVADDVQTLRKEMRDDLDDLVDWHSLQHLIGILTVIASDIRTEGRVSQNPVEIQPASSSQSDRKQVQR